MTATNLEKKIVNYWNHRPCNVKHSAKPMGSREFFNEVSARRFLVEPHIPEFAGFHLWNGKRVLEIGCGIGSDAEEFAKHGAEYVGIDISHESITLSQQRFEVMELEGEFHTLDASAGLAHLGQFDMVYSYGVIHHFPGIDRIVQNVNDVLINSGEFRFMVYAKDSWKYAMIQKGLDQFEAQAGCPYAQAFTKNDIHQLLKDNWNIERLRQDHCFMYNIDAYRQGNYQLEPWFEAMPEVYRQAVREYLGWHLLVKAKKSI